MSIGSTHRFDSIAPTAEAFDQTAEQMERLALRFVAAAGRYASSWIEQCVVGAVERDVRTKELSRDQLEHFPQDLRRLVASAPAAIKREFASSRIWIHRTGLTANESEHEIYARYERRDSGNKIDEPIRRVLGMAGVLLQEYGCLPSSDPTFDLVVPRYCLAMTWPVEILETTAAYGTAARLYVALSRAFGVTTLKHPPAPHHYRNAG